jgi:tRNA(Ile)-lysidine synthase
MPADSASVTAAEFAAALGDLGPFEAPPHLAVAVSGGADSTALAVLGRDWVRRQGGTLTALIVDHGLRPGSAEEASGVAARMTGLAIPAVVLGATGEAPRRARSSQAAARALRYDRLLAWCRAKGVLHLLVGHHRRDQAETVLMRLLHGSGVHGLAGMARCRELADVRLLRPLLGFDPDRLRAVLRRRGNAWIEDPTNARQDFERNRLRWHRNELAVAGLSEDALLRLAADAGRARVRSEEQLAVRIAASCRPSPFGHVVVDAAGLAADGPEVAARLLVRVLAMVGGRPWPPGEAAASRLFAVVASARHGPVGTLGGCVVTVTEEGILVCRERRNLPSPRPVSRHDFGPRGQGEIAAWDGRFRIRWQIAEAACPPALAVRCLGDSGVRQWSEHTQPPPARVPRAVLATLPALFAGEDLVAVPFGDRQGSGTQRRVEAFEVAFRPRWNLAGHGYFLSAANSIMM